MKYHKYYMHLTPLRPTLEMNLPKIVRYKSPFSLNGLMFFFRSGEPGLVDKVLALRRGFDSHRGHMSERFFRSNRPGYPHPVSSELENSGIRVAVGDCSVTERRRWRPPYQTGKTVHVHAKHYKHEDGRTAPGVCGNGSVPLSHSGNVVTRIGIHTHTHGLMLSLFVLLGGFIIANFVLALTELKCEQAIRYFVILLYFIFIIHK